LGAPLTPEKESSSPERTRSSSKHGIYALFGPYRSHFLSKKSLIAAKNETKEKRWKEEEETLNSTCEQASKQPCLRVNEATAA
jgi:hypothetical protein